MKILIGADPEIFVSKIIKKERFAKNNKYIFDGHNPPNMARILVDEEEIVSAYGLIPGTKKEPFPVKDGAVQVDGTALEFNITPAETSEEFVHNIDSVLSQLKTMIPLEYSFSENITTIFNNIYTFPEEARRIGCDPDYNAYTEKQNLPYNEHQLGTMRFVGGHIHIGWTENTDPLEYSHFLSCCQIAKQMDYFLLLPSLLFDTDKQRKNYYGQPGTFRPKPYGVEYRSLSNFWLHDKKLTKMIFDQAIKGVNLYVDKNINLSNKYSNVIMDLHSNVIYGTNKNNIKNFIKKVPEVYEGIKELVDAA